MSLWWSSCNSSQGFMKSTFSSVSFLSAPDNKDVFHPLLLFNHRMEMYTLQPLRKEKLQGCWNTAIYNVSALFSLLETSITLSHSWAFWAGICFITDTAWLAQLAPVKNNYWWTPWGVHLVCTTNRAYSLCVCVHPFEAENCMCALQKSHLPWPHSAPTNYYFLGALQLPGQLWFSIFIPNRHSPTWLLSVVCWMNIGSWHPAFCQWSTYTYTSTCFKV